MKQKPSNIGGALGLDKGETIELLRRAPPLLVLCIDRNLRPKFDFFSTKMRASQEQVRAAVLSNPRLLCYGLDRFQERWVTIRHMLMVPDPTFNDFWRKVCTWPDHKFHTFVHKCRREGDA